MDSSGSTFPERECSHDSWSPEKSSQYVAQTKESKVCAFVVSLRWLSSLAQKHMTRKDLKSMGDVSPLVHPYSTGSGPGGVRSGPLLDPVGKDVDCTNAIRFYDLYDLYTRPGPPSRPTSGGEVWYAPPRTTTCYTDLFRRLTGPVESSVTSSTSPLDLLRQATSSGMSGPTGGAPRTSSTPSPNPLTED